MINTYGNLYVCALNAEQHARTCGYWYLVQVRFSPHTAFATRSGLERWLDERGLSCEIPTAVQPEDYGKGILNWCAVVGSYRRYSHMSYDEFYALPVFARTKVLDNGAYTIGIITNDDDGVRTVHHMNCNCHDRIEYEYTAARKEMS